MALRCHMRLIFIIFVFLLSGCATLTKAETKSPLSEIADKALSANTLSAGECGLYVWKADAAKTFLLFASPSGVSYMKDGQETSLTEQNPVVPPQRERIFMDTSGQSLNLTLTSAEQITGGTRYKAGRLTRKSDEGWDIVVPVVGFYACQPLI